MKLHYLLLLPFVIFAACGKHATRTCEPPPRPGVEQLSFGTFYGECAGNCVNIYTLDWSRLQKNDSAQYPSLSLTYELHPTRTLSTDKFIAAKGLLYSVPKELLTNNNVTYGDPDGHDQGGIYVEFYQGKTKQRFLIDNDNTADQSAELISFKQKISDLMIKLR